MSTSPSGNDWSEQPSSPADATYGRPIATFNDVFNNFGFAASLVFKPGIIVYYLAHMLIGFGTYVGLLVALVFSIGAMEAVQEPGQAAAPPDFSPYFFIGMAGLMLYLFVLGALGVGPMASIRRAARGELHEVNNIGTTFKTSLRAGILAIPVMFIVNLIVGFGALLLLLPGLAAAFFLTPAIYLVVTGQAGTFESISMSFYLVKKHAGAVGALWVVLVGGYVLLFTVGMCLGLIPIIGSFIALAIQLVAYAVFFFTYVSTMLSIDAAENNWRLGQAHSGIEDVFE